MSNLKVNTINDASGGSNAVLYGVAAPTNSMGFRNRIINGDMRIDQRNAGASVTANNANATVYPIDRWAARSVTPSTSGAFTVQQSSVAPTGFNNSILATVSVAATPASTDQFFIQQRIEGFNVADLGLGTAAPSTFTLSFWVRSSLTGAFGGNVGNNVNLSYPFSFTINAANTWEQKTITIVGPTTGTWNTTNGQGLLVHFSLGAGASKLGTANTWANYPVAPSGSVNWISNAGATFYITGVQLEAGTVASPFERRDYGRELMMCQRYYQNVNYGGTWYAAGTGVMVDMEDRAFGGPQFFTVMRATPTFSITADGGGSQSIRSYGGDPLRTVTSVSVTTSGMSSCTHSGTYTLGRPYAATWKAEAEL